MKLIAVLLLVLYSLALAGLVLWLYQSHPWGELVGYGLLALCASLTAAGAVLAR